MLSFSYYWDSQNKFSLVLLSVFYEQLSVNSFGNKSDIRNVKFVYRFVV
jgi:hypothetical protein